MDRAAPTPVVQRSAFFRVLVVYLLPILSGIAAAFGAGAAGAGVGAMIVIGMIVSAVMVGVVFSKREMWSPHGGPSSLEQPESG